MNYSRRIIGFLCVNCIFITYFWHWTRLNPTLPRRRISWPNPTQSDSTQPNPTQPMDRPNPCPLSNVGLPPGLWLCRYRESVISSHQVLLLLYRRYWAKNQQCGIKKLHNSIYLPINFNSLVGAVLEKNVRGPGPHPSYFQYRNSSSNPVQRESLQCEAQQTYPPRHWNIVVINLCLK